MKFNKNGPELAKIIQIERYGNWKDKAFKAKAKRTSLKWDAEVKLLIGRRAAPADVNINNSFLNSENFYFHSHEHCKNLNRKEE